MCKKIKKIHSKKQKYSIALALIFACLLSPGPLFSQNVIGVPEILNYTKQNYNAGTQNTGIAQGGNGVMYFANSLGLLTFDGVYWDLYKLQNRTALLSLAIDHKGKIFAGGQGEIGFFSPDAFGRLQYHGLNQLLSPADNLFTEVWNVSIYGEHVLFRTNNKIFDYFDNRIQVYQGSYWSFLGKIGKRLLAYDSGVGLVELKNGSRLSIIPQKKLENVGYVAGIGQDSLLIYTLNSNLFIYNKNNLVPLLTQPIREIAASKVSCMVKLLNGNIAFGTTKAGVYIIDKNGSLIQRISKADGLQSQNILTIKQDKVGNLWIGSDSGIDIICYGDAIKHIYPEKENRNSGFTSAVFNHRLYLGTTGGLYYLPLENLTDISKAAGIFSPVKHFEGQTWKLSEVYDKLVLGGATGLFSIDKDIARPIDQSTGYWCVQALKDKESSEAIAGTFNGANLIEFSSEENAPGRLKNKKTFESARFLVQHGDTTWAAHSYRGVFKIAINKEHQIIVTKYADIGKVVSPNHNKIFKALGKLVLLNDNGVFEYNDKQHLFVKSIFFAKIFGTQLIDHLYEDRYGNLWFTSNKKIGVLSKVSSYSRVFYFDELENKITFNFENINVIDSSNVIIGAEKGFFHLNLLTYRFNQNGPTVLISHVSTVINRKDSLLYGGFGELHKPLSIEHINKDITISFAATEYRHPSNIQYSYQLKGFDEAWSEWNSNTSKEYSNLSPGSYTFKVKCRDGKNGGSNYASYSFEILPAWYQAWWAKLSYLLIVVGLLIALLKYQQIRFNKRQQMKLKKQKLVYEEEQKRLHVEHQFKVQEKEKQIILLTNEKLQAELNHRNQDLASSAMNLVRKIEVMSKLKNNLEQYRLVTDDEISRKEFAKIIKTIDGEIDDQQEWEQFTTLFDHIHHNFLRNLKAHYPDISANELKLSAYLKLNISTKEIAQLMNISVRGVETARFRLRKKLSVSGDINLHDFLIGFNEEKSVRPSE